VKPARIENEFPAPSYRGTQQQALQKIRKAFESGNDVVLVRAPTGSGKSLLARAIAGCARPPDPDEAEPGDAIGAYYTTPQISQLDDVASDSLLEDLQIIRGKRNYSCLLPGENETSVDRAPCVRESGFDCSIKHRCPYFSDRDTASNSPIAAMTLAYFMQTAGSDTFGQRDVVVIDEAHGLEEWAEMYAAIELRPQTVPLWDDIAVPNIDSVEEAATFAEQVKKKCVHRKDTLIRVSELSISEVAERDRLQELISNLDWFVSDHRNPESTSTWIVDQPDGKENPVTIKPLHPERYLQHTVWDRGEKFVLLSATILDKDGFCWGAGLDPDSTALVDISHSFPVENRPLFDVTQGKMTYDHRDETLPKIARLLVRLLAEHPNEKGLVHAHSYGIAEKLTDQLQQFGVSGRVRTHNRSNRDEQLGAWLASDEPELFISVKMEEALDLEGDLARWQVLCKAPYPNTRDSRVARRLEDDQWGWYYRTTLKTVIQACGRVVRSPDDFGATYLADSSLLDLFGRARSMMPHWFEAQVERMATPELPVFDPDTASRSSSSSSSPSLNPQPQQSANSETLSTKDIWNEN
jgi:Rad3-related DNA helicase